MKLSSEINVLLSAEKAKRLDEIRTRVKSDFYFRPEVREKVVEGLCRDFQNIVFRQRLI